MTPDPLNPQPGDQYHRDTPHGIRRYEVTGTYRASCGESVHLACLEPPMPGVPGYRGGASGEARVLIGSLRDPRAGWQPGHPAVLADAA